MVDLRQDPNWKAKAPYGLHAESGEPITQSEYEALHGRDLTVRIDTSTIEELARKKIAVEEKEAIIDEKLAEVEHAEATFEYLKSKVAEKYEKEHLEVPKIENMEDVDKMAQNLTEIRRKTQSSGGLASGGSAPLNSAQYSTEKKEGYGSVEEMIRDLREKSAMGDANSKEILSKMTYKMGKGIIEGKLSLPSYEPEPTPTTTTDLIEGGGKIAVKPDPLGIEHAFRKKKLLVLAQKGDQTAINILNSGDY
jgi:hypothetical protein